MASIQQSKGNTFSLARLFAGEGGNIVRLALTVIVIFVLLGIAKPEDFLTLRNMKSMALQASEIGVLAIAITLAMLSGGIDLSVVSTANLAGIIAGLVLGALVPPESAAGTVAGGMVSALAAALAVGLACGVFNGFLIAVLELPPILATLGTLLIYKGIGTGITRGTTIFGIDQSQFIGNGELVGIPVPLIILAVVAVVIAIVLNRTRFGLRLYMLGTNPVASRFSGIDNRRVLITTYIVSGVLASVAGIIILGRTNAANVDFGGPYVLMAILVAVLGDVDPYGGSGRVLGVILALVALQFLSTGFNMLLFRSSGANFFKEFAWGGLLLLVLLLNWYSRLREQQRASRGTGQAAQE
jgi:simple sugar transport system permease protein